MMKCKKCGQELGEQVTLCPICGANQTAYAEEQVIVDVSETRRMAAMEDEPWNETIDEGIELSKKSRMVAGLLQLFLGGFGLGRFYLGYSGIAVLQLLTLPLFGIGYIWGFIDGILILCGQLDFDAEGLLLK